MQDFRKRRSRTNELLRAARGLLGIAALAVLAVAAGRAAWGMYGKFAAASEARAVAERELAQLQEQYAGVEAQVALLASERGMEGALRERYGVARPGEGEIDIVRQAPTSTPQGERGQNWLVKLWHSLFVW